MSRFKIIFISMVVFLFAISIAAAQAQADTKEELAKLQNDLANANREVMAYRNNLLATPQIVALNKEIADLDKSIRTKTKELESLLDAKYNENPEFVELLEKLKEVDSINSELVKIRNDIESAPEIKNMEKEAADLRAKAFTMEQEAKKLVKSKLDSNEKFKKLQDKKAGLGDVAAELTKFRKDIMNSSKDVMNAPDIKVLQAEIAKLEGNLTAKVLGLHKTAESILKTLSSDEKFKALEQNIRDLNQKIENLRKRTQVTPVPKAN